MFMLLFGLALFTTNTQAFSTLPTDKRMAFIGAQTLFGKSRIQRVGPSDDSDDDMISFLEEENAIKEEVKVPTMSLDELLLPSTKCDVNQVGPTALAYIGDVVFELMVRARHVWPTRRTSDLQQQVVALVRGECCAVRSW